MQSTDETKQESSEVQTQNSTTSLPSVTISTAQKVFGGKQTGTGLMCSNLKPNPFMVDSATSCTSSFTSTTNTILAKPKFSLKPSSFGSSSSPSLSSGLDSKPQGNTCQAVSNPFLRPAKLNYDSDVEDVDKSEEKHSAATAEKSVSQTESLSNLNSRGSDKRGNEPNGVNSVQNSQSASATIIPELASHGQTLPATMPIVASSFVFGEKLDDRVTNVKENGSANGEHTAESEKPKAKTLEEAVDEYKKQQESGPLLPEVETKTGEELEANVLQINCKLFLFHEKDKSWAEKGRGLLRLNDQASGSHSRIVMRTAATHKVILNTNIWPTMICDRANQKSLRITGTSPEVDGVHIYLVTGSTADIEHLTTAITYRLQKARQNQRQAADNTEKSQDASPSAAAGAASKRKPTDDGDNVQGGFDDSYAKKTRLESLDSEGASNDSATN